MIQTNTIGSFTEIYVGGGNFITQSRPTYFHTFSTRKILAGDEKIEDFMEVTPAQQANILEHDASFVRPPRLFIAQWNAACGKYGRYNPETGYFELNGLTDITYEEAILIYSKWSNSNLIREQYLGAKIRTNIPQPLRDVVNAENAFYGSSIEVVNLTYTSPGWVRCSLQNGIFRRCQHLKRIITPLENPGQGSIDFENCRSLEEVRIKNSQPKDLYLSACSKLSFDSVDYIIRNGTSKGFTVHVHKDVYAKLTGDTTNAAAAALTEEELAQWQQLLVDAAEKQITFATT